MTKRVLMVSVDAPPTVGGVSNFAHHCANRIARTCEEAVFVGPKGTCVPAGYEQRYTIVVDEASNVSSRSGPAYAGEAQRLKAFLETLVRRHRANHIRAFHPFYYGPPLTDVAAELSIPCDFVAHGTELTSQFPELMTGGGELHRVKLR